MKRSNSSDEIECDDETSQIAKKPKILDEDHVEDQVMDSLYDAGVGDLRKLLKIDDGKKIQVKWTLEFSDDTSDSEAEVEIESKWLNAVVTKAETGKTHRFVDEDDEEDFEDVPVVEITYDEDGYDDEEEVGPKRVCFVGDHLLYDLEHDAVLHWRCEGDDFDDEITEVVDEQNGATYFKTNNHYHFTAGNEEEIKNTVAKIFPDLFVDILGKYRTEFNNLPFNTQRNWSALILLLKDRLVEKVSTYFAEKINDQSIKEGDLIQIDRGDIDEFVNTLINDATS
jgi:hypothetical protein